MIVEHPLLNAARKCRTRAHLLMETKLSNTTMPEPRRRGWYQAAWLLFTTANRLETDYESLPG